MNISTKEKKNLNKPFFNNLRPFKGKHAQDYYSNPQYVDKDVYSPPRGGGAYVRAFHLLQQEMFKIFEFVEPSDTNLKCYSLQLHGLILKTCVELEANFRNILKNNGYNRKRDSWSMNDTKKLEKTHKLSYYKVHLPRYDGATNIRQPFKNWKDNENLDWFNAYHGVKHDRVANFPDANLDNLLDSICGLLVVLSSQFCSNNFDNTDPLSHSFGYTDRYITHRRIAIGRYFLIEFPAPEKWSEDERYENFDREFREKPECSKIFDIG